VGIETSSKWPMPSWPDPLDPKAKSFIVWEFVEERSCLVIL
jgi:hypothetical protein